MFLKAHKIPYNTRSSVNDGIANLTFITSARFHLEGVIRQAKKKPNPTKPTNKKIS